MAGWIKTSLGTEVDLGPGHFVLDGVAAPPKGAQPPVFGPCLLWPNCWMDEDATWYGSSKHINLSIVEAANHVYTA